MKITKKKISRIKLIEKKSSGLSKKDSGAEKNDAFCDETWTLNDDKIYTKWLSVSISAQIVLKSVVNTVNFTR